MSSIVAAPSPEPAPSRKRLSPQSVAGRRRLAGLGALTIVLLVAFGVADLTTLDGVRDGIAAETSDEAARTGVPADQITNCFQGYCFEDDVGMTERWWRFSSTFVRLMWPAVALAVVAGALVDTLVLPRRRVGLRNQRTKRVAGPALDPAALVATLMLFSPVFVGLRIGAGMAVVAVLALLFRERDRSPTDAELGNPTRAVVEAVTRFGVVLVPAFLGVAALGGLATQHLTEAGVDAVVGDHMIGIAVVAVGGLALTVPRFLELPLAGAGLLLGMGRFTAATLLVAAAIPGGALVWQRGRRSTLAAALVATVVVGTGAVAIATSSWIDARTVPVIAYNGTTCTYEGPSTFGTGVHDFTIRNQTVREGDGHTMAVVIGRLPDNVSADHFALSVSADPAAPLPNYFTVAGTQEFVFPGTEAVAPITFHNTGRYVPVCLDGGGHYVILEFSMPQPLGWFDEFRSTFTSYVAEEMLLVTD